MYTELLVKIKRKYFLVSAYVYFFKKNRYQASPNTEEESRWNGWTLEGGFKSYQTLNELHSTKKMPLRALAPGLHMGLSVILDAKAEDYYCTGHESVGFKVCPKFCCLEEVHCLETVIFSCSCILL